MGRIAIKRKIRIKKVIKPDACRIIQDGKGCDRDVHCRGLCGKHHTYLVRHKLVEKYGAKTIHTYFEKTKYTVSKKLTPSKCHMIENGKKCKGKTHGRGLCVRHWLLFNRHGLLAKYGGASRKDLHTFGIKKRIKEGICRIIEDGKRCDQPVNCWGLCGKHCLRFRRHGKLEVYGKKTKKRRIKANT